MKLAVFHPGFTKVGGAEILAATQARYFLSEGLELEIVTLASDPGAWKSLLGEIPVKAVPRHHWTDLFCAYTRLQKLRARARRALPMLKGHDAVLVYNFPCSTILGLEPMEAARIWQCNEPPRRVHLAAANPTLTARAMGLTEEAEDRATQAFHRKLANHNREMARGGGLSSVRAQDLETVAALDAVYAISAFSRDNARQIYGRCEEQPIYPAVIFPERHHSRRGLDRSGLRVLVHSRLESPKNLDTVIRGFARFQAKNLGAVLHLVGEGPEEDFLKALALHLLPPAAFHFHGFLPAAELQEVYQACDVFALLTLDEPFGLVYPEAAARGLLLIGPDHGGPLEILEGGTLGRICDPFSPEALAEALENIWAMDDQEVEALRERTDRACRSRYSPEVVGRAQVKLIAKTVGLKQS